MYLVYINHIFSLPYQLIIKKIISPLGSKKERLHILVYTAKNLARMSQGNLTKNLNF